MTATTRARIAMTAGILSLAALLGGGAVAVAAAVHTVAPHSQYEGLAPSTTYEIAQTAAGPATATPPPPQYHG